jgi:hypothetical protein
MLQSCRTTWRLLRRKGFGIKSLASQRDTTASGNEMRKVLGAVDLTFMGIGGIIGAGVFVLTGVAARQAAGCATEHPCAGHGQGAQQQPSLRTVKDNRVPIAGARIRVCGAWAHCCCK